MRFADGSPLTVDDAKWSLERAANKETGGQFQFLLASIGGVETQGTDSVILRLKHPDPTMLQALATFNAGIVPSKLIMAEPGPPSTTNLNLLRNIRSARGRSP